MSSIDQQFVEYIVKSLVGNPDAVQVERRIDEKGVLLELTVDSEDLGRVIGKRGATAQSLRTLLRALGTKNDARYNLKIVDNGDPRPPRDDPNNIAAAAPPPDQSQTDDDDVSSDIGDDNDSKDNSVNDSATEQEPAEAADQPSDVVSKTRKELEDLDDLDV